jgi:hypothetical protein
MSSDIPMYLAHIGRIDMLRKVTKASSPNRVTHQAIIRTTPSPLQPLRLFHCRVHLVGRRRDGSSSNARSR